MPIRYLNRRRRRRIKSYVRGAPGRFLRYGVDYALGGGLRRPIVSEAKRFISAFAASALTVGANTRRIVLTTVPRNLTATTENEDNRLGRMIYIKGCTVSYEIRADSSNTQPSMIRATLVWQKDPNEDLTDGTWTKDRFFAPFGATRGCKILYDKYFAMVAPGGTSGTPIRALHVYRKIGRMTKYSGAAVDGTDITTGAVVLYFSINPDRNSTTSIFTTGNGTLSYRETQ